MNTRNKRILGYFLSLIIPSVLSAQDAPKPYGVLPTERQLLWQEMEMYCLIHYTPTTFQNKEWGFGDADPAIFNPTKFDAQQIVDAAAAGGFKGIISVAKHHDGFCLWPTSTTQYSVKSALWKGGKGDMVKEFMQATHQKGLKFGLYLSAWDRHDTRYGTPAYADAYRAQLTELMSNYGELFTSWHDGANGGDGYYGGKNEKRKIDRATYYAWHEKTWPIVREKQPLAVIFSDIGPDIRWVGNESGFADETSWATFSPKGIDGHPAVPGQADYKEAPSGTRNGAHWIPAECDVPLRHGWFYHKEEDSKVKTPDQLFSIYLKSVGRGAALDLGLAPMPAGQLHPNDVKSLQAFGKKLKETFGTNLANGATVNASNLRANSKKFTPNLILDEDRYSYYASDDEVLNPELEVGLAGSKEFDLIRLRENIKLGQRLDSVVVQAEVNGKWEHLATATSIGGNRLIKLPHPVTATKLKIRLYAPVAPTLSDFGLFKEFVEPFAFENTSANYTKLTRNDFKINTKLPKSIDADPMTIEVVNGVKNAIVFESKQPVTAIGYLPRQDGKSDGMVLKYEVATSDDGNKWAILHTGEFSNIQANPIEQTIRLSTPTSAKFIRFTPKETVGKSFSVAEFSLYK
ncbi:alpha-L-fucosidase [Sphingobacterium sp. ML3W]|uniref:alpha-L-fucosidase n=1 Tax=Sphingobacterium sp. ML3W TaxID=1538644 RepID=UPI00249A69DA|nr:alpha-L-fucosidase [Sphingobacterium sp. ML3W]WFA79154.1 alpha-L-fucosidase [Sphingobacterium sp. ML3W]